MKNQKGITLVALVVTIVVLLILAGVTIAAVLSDGGIFGAATSAKTQSSESTAKELVAMGVLAVQTNLYAPEVKDSTTTPVTNYTPEEAFQRAIGSNASNVTITFNPAPEQGAAIKGNGSLTVGGTTYNFTVDTSNATNTVTVTKK